MESAKKRKEKNSPELSVADMCKSTFFAPIQHTLCFPVVVRNGCLHPSRPTLQEQPFLSTDKLFSFQICKKYLLLDYNKQQSKDPSLFLQNEIVIHWTLFVALLLESF